MPFGTIIELGILEPGITLTDERGRIRARGEGRRHAQPLPGGRARSTASAREVQGKSRLQRLDLLALRGGGRRKPIDALREVARRQLGLSAPAAFPGIAAAE